MKATLEFVQKAATDGVNPRGWFDPRCCVFYLREIPGEEKYDPNTTLMRMAGALHLDEDKTEELKTDLQDDFNRFLDGLPKEMVDEWKAKIGASPDYKYDPSKEFSFSVPFGQRSQQVFSEIDGHVSIHEYFHYLQFLRTTASPMLIWAFMNLRDKAQILFQVAKRAGQRTIRYPIDASDRIHAALWSVLDDPALWNILEWHYSRPNFLSANDIREAEAEFNSILAGKHFLRFRYYHLAGHPITLHFRDLNERAPQYARAYLETEAALGDFAPSLFPLITHFALSMPFKRYSWFNIEDFEPVHPEEAFQAALRFLKKDISSGHPYAKFAQSLYKSIRNPIPSKVLRNFSKRVCKSNGWIHPGSRKIRQKWINRIYSMNPFLRNLYRLFYDALYLEQKHGEEIFSEPATKNHEPILQSLPLPPLILREGLAVKSVADEYWFKDFGQAVALIRVQMGAAFSLFVNADVENECPHTACQFRKSNLCHGVFTYPETAEECGFPGFIEDWSGLPFSAFVRRR